MRAMCALERVLAAGLLHPDMEFRNMVYDPETLQIRIIDIGPVPGFDETPKELWRFFYADFAWWFKYTKLVTGFWWGVFNVLRVLLAYPLDLSWMNDSSGKYSGYFNLLFVKWYENIKCRGLVVCLLEHMWRRTEKYH